MNCSFELYKFPVVNNFHEYTIFWKRENSREIIRRGVDIRNRDNRFVFRANLLTLRVNWRWKNGQISSSQKRKARREKKVAFEENASFYRIQNAIAESWPSFTRIFFKLEQQKLSCQLCKRDVKRESVRTEIRLKIKYFKIFPYPP